MNSCLRGRFNEAVSLARNYPVRSMYDQPTPRSQSAGINRGGEMTFSDSQRQLSKEIITSVVLKVKIFCETGSPQLLEDEINKWIERQRLGPADIQKVTQSECGDNESGQVTISIWYIGHPK